MFSVLKESLRLQREEEQTNKLHEQMMEDFAFDTNVQNYVLEDVTDLDDVEGELEFDEDLDAYISELEGYGTPNTPVRGGND